MTEDFHLKGVYKWYGIAIDHIFTYAPTAIQRWHGDFEDDVINYTFLFIKKDQLTHIIDR